MKYVCIFVLLFNLGAVQAKPQYGTVTVSKVISVYDGDTFRVNIDSLPPIVGKNIPIRVTLQRYEESASMRRIWLLRLGILLEVN